LLDVFNENAVKKGLVAVVEFIQGNCFLNVVRKLLEHGHDAIDLNKQYNSIFKGQMIL